MDIDKAVELFKRRLNTDNLSTQSTASTDKMYDWKICQRCCTNVPKGNKFCSTTCEQLFKQGK